MQRINNVDSDAYSALEHARSAFVDDVGGGAGGGGAGGNGGACERVIRWSGRGFHCRPRDD